MKVISHARLCQKGCGGERGQGRRRAPRYGTVRSLFCGDEEDSLLLTTQRAERNQNTMFASTGNVTEPMSSLTAEERLLTEVL